MSWWCMWPLLLMAVNAGAELYLLKHGENLYCATDDEDTPALAWNHNLDMEDEPLESVYWSKPAPYSTINCKPEFRKRQCGGWNTTGWRTVHSYERDLPPVFDYRWNDFRRFVVNRGNNTRSHLFQQSVTELHFPVSLLLRDNAFIVLGNHEGWFWKIIIDGWIKSFPRMGVEWWFWSSVNAGKGFQCDDSVNCRGLLLHNGTRWTTFTLKYEAQRNGDILKLLNHETGIENTWKTDENLKSVKDLHFYMYPDSNGLFGHWRLHFHNILEPSSNTQPLSLRFVASVETQLCISITYIAKFTFPKTSEAYVQLSNYQVEVKRELLPLGNEWKTVKHVFAVTPGTSYVLRIFPPKTNVHGFAIGEIRACSVGEFRVSKIKSDAANECTDLKKNKVVSLKPVNEFIQNNDCPAGKHGYMCSERCKVICKNQKCNHVTGECTDGCDNGWQGTNCSIPGCRKLYYGVRCLQKCSTNCRGDGTCYQDTGHCIYGCTNNWTGELCDQCEDGRYGKNCSMLCSDNCMEYCNKDNGSCVQGCKPGWKGDTCNSECDVGSYGIGCRKKCNGKCKNDETCNAVDGHCFNGCEDGFTGEKCDLQPLSTLSIILISVGVLAFVLLGIGLIYSLVWILRLRLKLYKSLELHKNPAPPIGSSQQQARQEVLGADVVFYDEITENKTKRDKE